MLLFPVTPSISRNLLFWSPLNTHNTPTERGGDAQQAPSSPLGRALPWQRHPEIRLPPWKDFIREVTTASFLKELMWDSQISCQLERTQGEKKTPQKKSLTHPSSCSWQKAPPTRWKSPAFAALLSTCIPKGSSLEFPLPSTSWRWHTPVYQ